MVDPWGVGRTVLDHLDGLELSADEAHEHFDSLMALARLGEGLWWLNQVVSELEWEARPRLERDNILFELVEEPTPVGRVSCVFQWYAVSACNYAQLVGWLATGDTSRAKQYVGRVMPRLRTYRNKVAAHFARTAPQGDNEADLAASVMTHVAYAGGRLSAAALRPIKKRDGQMITVSRNLSWSLTLTHERLTPRYWPSGPPKAYQVVQLPPGETIIDTRWDDLFGTSA